MRQSRRAGTDARSSATNGRSISTEYCTALTAPCLLCGITPAGSAALYTPNDRQERTVVYALCRACADTPGWGQRAESVLYGERAT